MLVRLDERIGSGASDAGAGVAAYALDPGDAERVRDVSLRMLQAR